MLKFQGELISDECGRECVCFTTPSGVKAIVDTSISMAALESFAKSLERKMRRAGNWPDTLSQATKESLKARRRSKAP